MLISHNDVANGNSVPEEWCQQDSSQLMNFFRIMDANFMDVYNIRHNSNFPKSLFSIFLVELEAHPLLQR